MAAVLLYTSTVSTASVPSTEAMQPMRELPEQSGIVRPLLPMNDPKDDFRYCEYFTYNGTEHHPGLMTEAEQRYTYDLCQRYGLEYYIVLGLMGVESGWNIYIRAVNGHAGVGMVSVRYNYERMLALGLDLYDALDGIECMCIVLAEKLNKYCNYAMALIAYNSGDTGAQRYFNQGVYSTGYSDKVLGFAEAIEDERKGK